MPTHVGEEQIWLSLGLKEQLFFVLPSGRFHLFRQFIYKKTWFSTGKMKYYIETFRTLGVARGHSSYKLTKSVSFYCSVRKSSCQVH